MAAYHDAVLENAIKTFAAAEAEAVFHSQLDGKHQDKPLDGNEPLTPQQVKADPAEHKEYTEASTSPLSPTTELTTLKRSRSPPGTPVRSTRARTRAAADSDSPSASIPKSQKGKAKGKKKEDDESDETTRRGNKWTAADLEALFTAALGSGPSMKMFEGKVPGRTAKQCHDTWR